MALPRIGITAGDPAGIGPEVAERAARDPSVLDVCEPVLYATPGADACRPGVVSAAAGRAAYRQRGDETPRQVCLEVGRLMGSRPRRRSCWGSGSRRGHGLNVLRVESLFGGGADGPGAGGRRSGGTLLDELNLRGPRPRFCALSNRKLTAAGGAAGCARAGRPVPLDAG